MTIAEYLDNSQALEVAVLAKTSPESIRNGLTEKINETDNPDPNLIYCAGFYCGPEITERLIQLLNSEDKSTWFEAASTLIMIGDFRGMVPVMRQYLLKQADFDEIFDVTVITLGFEEYINKQKLSRALKHTNPDIRLSAAIAAAPYEKFKSKAYEILLENYHDNNPLVREQVIIALAKVDFPEIAEMFLKELETATGEIVELFTFAIALMENSLPQLSLQKLKDAANNALQNAVKPDSPDIGDLLTAIKNLEKKQ